MPAAQKHTKADYENEVAMHELMTQFYDDPYGYVMWAFPWGQPGILEEHTGPDTWQLELMECDLPWETK